MDLAQHVARHSSATPEQYALIGRHIDRLVTVEARISPTSRNVIVNLHEAACAAQGGGPLSMLAARQILEHLGPGKTVFITTGAGDPRFLPAGETDGPPGVAALALAIHAATGAVPLLFTEAPFVDNLAATTLAVGLGIREPRHALDTGYTTAVLPLAYDETAEQQAAHYLDTYKPALVISIEKIGPNSRGIAHTSTGTPTAGDRARAECLFDEAARRGIPSLGIGDNGNEIGFGLIPDAVAKYKPNGERLCTRVKTDVLVPANTSNWGAYAVEAALAVLTGKPEIMHSAETERRMIEACVDAHGADGSTGRHILQVDGMPAEMSCAVVTMLGIIVRNGLLSGFKRAF
ncbi:glutamate cyclase domain-containing protein [Reyranella sp.]|uniref:glutamate cyclase domain-containing protein n=1 Tax=Reyranella sp. TaxID=1929291 RepID=UPI003BA96FDB